jgi:hypothetical protein
MRHRHAVLSALAVVVLACVQVAQAGDLPPRRRGPLLGWLRDFTYRATYVGEPAVHPSDTAHGANVRTYYNAILVEDLAAGRVPFRKGAAMVKELYFSGTEDVIGWSVMRKVRGNSGSTGRGWLFYETLDGTNAGAFYGRGKPICTGCHADGTDYLLSPFRP